MGTFDERIRYLEEQVGDGHITAGCVVDQPYAQNQHETESFKHVRGRSHYLGGPLMENALSLVTRIVNSVITETGSRLREEMIDVADTMNGYVENNAPKDPDVGDVLSKSGSPYVDDNGMRIYSRPPRTGRSYDHR
jgi:hypothetical protein